MSAFTGQQLCIPPNKAYSASTGYGCFAYIPMMWFEDGRTVNTEEFYRLNDHFYTRPGSSSSERFSVLTRLRYLQSVLSNITGRHILQSFNSPSDRYPYRIRRRSLNFEPHSFLPPSLIHNLSLIHLHSPVRHPSEYWPSHQSDSHGHRIVHISQRKCS